MNHPHTVGTYNRILLILVITAVLCSCEKEDPKEPVSPYESVNGFVISEAGEKLLATSNGLYSFLEGSGSIELTGKDTPVSPIRDLTFTNKSYTQELWLASPAGAFNYTLQVYINVANSGLHSDEVNHIHVDQDNISYFATPEGLSILNQPEWILSTGQDDLYLNFEITDMGSTSNGFTYVTTLGGGIERFSIDVDGISGATLFDTDWTGLESNYIHTVFIDDTIQAYGTDQGAALHFSEYTKRDWMVYTTNDGLISDTVLAIVRDHSDNWWFGTTRGISRLSESQWTSYSIETHPIISNQVKFLAVDPEGSVWIATDQGLSKFMNEQWVSYPK